MIEVIADNGSLVMKVDQDLTLSRNSPLYFKAEEFTLPFTLPDKPNNPTFGYPGRPGSKTRILSQSARLRVSGIHINTGLLNVLSTDEAAKTIETSFRANRSDFMFLYGDKSVRSLNWSTRQYVSGVSNPTGQQLIDSMKSSATSNLAYLAFPVWASNYYGTGVGDWINKWDFEAFNFDINHYKRSIFPRLHLVISELFSILGYTINSNWFSVTDERKSIVIFNMDNITSGSYNFGDKIPGMTVSEFITALENFFPISFFINSHNKSVDIISSSSIIGSSPVKLQGQLVKGRKMTFDSDSKTGYDLTFTKLDNDKSTEQAYDYVDDTKWFGEVNSFADLPAAIEGLQYYVKASGMLYEGKKDNDTAAVTWEPVGNRCQGIRNGGGNYKKEISLFPVVNKTQTVNQDCEIAVSGTPQIVNLDITLQTPWTDSPWSRWSDTLRLTVFRGLQMPDIDESSLPSGFVYSTDKTYPMASFVGYKLDGSRWLSNYIDLTFQGDYSIFDSDKIDLLDNSEKAEEKILMTVKEYQEFVMKNIYSLRGQKALPYETSGKITNQSNFIELTATFLTW